MIETQRSIWRQNLKNSNILIVCQWHRTSTVLMLNTKEHDLRHTHTFTLYCMYIAQSSISVSSQQLAHLVPHQTITYISWQMWWTWSGRTNGEYQIPIKDTYFKKSVFSEVSSITFKGPDRYQSNSTEKSQSESMHLDDLKPITKWCIHRRIQSFPYKHSNERRNSYWYLRDSSSGKCSALIIIYQTYFWTLTLSLLLNYHRTRENHENVNQEQETGLKAKAA